MLLISRKKDLVQICGTKLLTKLQKGVKLIHADKNSKQSIYRGVEQFG